MANRSFIFQIFNQGDSFKIESIELVSDIPDDATIIFEDTGRANSTPIQKICVTRFSSTRTIRRKPLRNRGNGSITK